MKLSKAITRAARAMREDLQLHLISVSSLTVAFLCLAGALWGMSNLSEVAGRWGRAGHITVYLADDASPEQLSQLRLLLGGMDDVRSTRYLSQEDAQQEFVRDSDLSADLTALPVEVFPASLEIELTVAAGTTRSAEIAERIASLDVVDGVETYAGWFGRLGSLLVAARIASTVLAMLVLLCVLFVIGNTIRLLIAGRRDEIEVLKLCGASNSFVRGPFLIEGAVQGFLSATAAVLLLLIGYFALRGEIDATFGTISGMQVSFLPPLLITGLVVGGTLIGAAGSAISLRRYLTV